MRNKVKYMAFLRKRCNVNPKKGPNHFRSPSKILWRTIRGMIPHKTSRGAAALGRLRTYEGVPPPYDRLKRVVVPSAFRVLRLAPGRKYCVLGRLSKEMGWHYSETVAKLEAKRKSKAAVWYARKKKIVHSVKKAVASAPLPAEINAQLQKFGH